MEKKNFTLKPGLNSCTNAEYHGDKNYYSSTTLKLLLKNPADFYDQYILGNKKVLSLAAFDEGSYAHAIILEPETIPEEFAFYPGMIKRGQEWNDFKEANKGMIILSKPQKMRVERWCKAYERRKAAVNLLSGGKPEVSLAGDLMGMPIKVRADYINVDKGYIADVKTTSYGSDRDTFNFTINQFSYHLSAALYSKMFELHYGKPFDFYFVVLGKKDESCEVFKASQDTMGRGLDAVRKAVDTYKQCKSTGIWTKRRELAIINEDDDYEILEV